MWIWDSNCCELEDAQVEPLVLEEQEKVSSPQKTAGGASATWINWVNQAPRKIETEKLDLQSLSVYPWSKQLISKQLSTDSGIVTRITP